jgi:hypothetical protein
VGRACCGDRAVYRYTHPFSSYIQHAVFSTYCLVVGIEVRSRIMLAHIDARAEKSDRDGYYPEVEYRNRTCFSVHLYTVVSFSKFHELLK